MLIRSECVCVCVCMHVMFSGITKCCAANARIIELTILGTAAKKALDSCATCSCSVMPVTLGLEVQKFRLEIPRWSLTRASIARRTKRCAEYMAQTTA